MTWRRSSHVPAETVLGVKSGKEEGPPSRNATAALLEGGAEGDRTPDLLNAIQARSQLRHCPSQKNDRPPRSGCQRLLSPHGGLGPDRRMGGRSGVGSLVAAGGERLSLSPAPVIGCRSRRGRV